MNKKWKDLSPKERYIISMDKYDEFLAKLKNSELARQEHRKWLEEIWAENNK